jgi:hypothetical protein
MAARILGWIPAILLMSFGCHSTKKQPPPLRIPDPTFSQYHSLEFSWASVRRALVLPFVNESIYTRADEEVARVFRGEMQALGEFEVVAPHPEDSALLSEQIHRGGRFNEEVMLELHKLFNADVIIHGTITQYTPYPRPRLGMVIQVVDPTTGKVVASIDGLWDATYGAVAERVLAFYRQRPQRHPFIENNFIAPDDGFADELALHSPNLFQRFVCAEALRNLVRDARLPPPPPKSDTPPEPSKQEPKKDRPMTDDLPPPKEIAPKMPETLPKEKEVTPKMPETIEPRTTLQSRRKF